MEESNEINYYNWNHEKNYAFLLNHPKFSKVLLVEISNESKVDKMLLHYYEDNVLYVPKIMKPIFKHRFEKYLQLGLEAAMASLLIEKSSVLSDYNRIHDEGIMTIIKSKIKLLMPLYTSRSNTKSYDNLMNTFVQVREKRKAEECHLPMSFHDDVCRSLHELNYVLEQNNLNFKYNT
mmetsp:Transcript_6503/g.9425  ORF Transcript_6503/g.9425 Transcript_6503/m.9425 type:complete len:178 (+) Transcript_6503:181-714(+)